MGENQVLEESESEVVEVAVRQEGQQKQAAVSRISNVPKYLFFILAFLLPLFVFPFSGNLLGFSKSLILYLFVLAAFIFYLLGVLQRGVIEIPKSCFFGALFFMLVVAFVSALFSESPLVSLFGDGSETSTFSFLLIISLALFLAFLIFRSEKDILSFFSILILSSLVLFILQVFYSFGLKIYPFEFFTGKTSTPVGTWNEMAIFFGFIALVSIIFFEFFEVGRWMKVFLVGMICLSLISMAFVNFISVWIVFGLLLLVLLVYLYSGLQNIQRFLRLPLYVVLAAMVFVLANNLIGDLVSSAGFDFIDARPSWFATAAVIKETFKEDAKNLFIGSGPNTFLYDWLKHKPKEVNQSIFFWNTRFKEGIGFLPSLVAELGLLATLAIIAALVVLLYHGFRSVAYSKNDVTRAFLLALFLGSIYLWVFTVVYVPSNFLLALSFITTGLFFALASKVSLIKTYKISIVKNPSLGFASSFVIVVFMILSVAGFYTAFQKYWSAYSFSRGLAEFNNGKVDKAEDLFTRAARLDNQDRYHRALTEVGLFRFSRLLNRTDLSPTEARARLQNIISFSITNAQKASKLNPLDPLNWMLLARVYESLVPLNFQNAKELSLENYQTAAEVSPLSPEPFVAMARVEIRSGDKEKARDYLNSSLGIKGDYAPALFLSAQLAATEGKLDEAISKTEQAKLVSPNDVGVLFQLGLLYYQVKDYQRAVGELERAVAIASNYSNARYFLGLAYDKLNQKEKAIDQFEKIQTLNPTNQEVKKIIENLKSGKAALENISPSPEEREEPPVGE
jgi:tetratricopeptide (TPR) repeat protein